MPRILVVDDDDAFLRLVREHLESTYEIVETGDATQALALTLERKPDCILMDLRLPEISGFELCSILSELTETRLIPIILVSGESAARLKEIAKVLRITGYLQKPFDFEDLKARIAAAIETKQAERRREPRVRLAIGMRIVGVDTAGNPFDIRVVTHDASASGFSCHCFLSLPIGTAVDVWMMSSEEPTRGRALVVRVERRDTSEQRYGFQFTQKPEHWLLR